MVLGQLKSLGAGMVERQTSLDEHAARHHSLDETLAAGKATGIGCSAAWWIDRERLSLVEEAGPWIYCDQDRPQRRP